MKILHITAHMGGGVGKAISGLVRYCNSNEESENKILVLEEPEKDLYIRQCMSQGIEIIVKNEDSKEEELLQWADVVVINWWNHPAMLKCLVEFPAVQVRVVLWSHVNGCTYPYLPFDFANLFEKVLITTAYTLENSIWNEEERKKIANKSQLVYGMGDFAPKKVEAKMEYEIKDSFVVGYAGTINYAKMHSEYIEYCKEIVEKIPNVHFLMIGEADKDVLNDVKKKGLESYFTFTGYVENVYYYYRQMDVLGYLLSKSNYATTENVLLEAMATGVPVVVYRNQPEEYILSDGNTGFFVENKEEYSFIMQKLYESKELRERVGKQARASVIQRYSVKENGQFFMKSMKEVCEKEKKVYSFQEVLGDSAYDWFCAYTGHEQEFFLNLDHKTPEEIEHFFRNGPSIYREKTKSSIQHFNHYFPEEKKLKTLCILLEKVICKGEEKCQK